MVGNSRRWSAVAMWRWAFLLVLLCAALARVSALKRAEMSPVPFVLGSRYGRSPPRMIAPRNDRFFLGSRYGKRSEAAEGAPGWRPACDCSHYARHAQPRTFYNRGLSAERVSTED